jgi:hypothetical protein
MDKEYVQRPKGDGKYLTVGDLLEMADALRRDEVPHDRLLVLEGAINLRNNIRGLRIRKG